MSDDLKRKIQVLRDNFEIFAERNLKIKTKDGSLENFIFNEPQKYIHAQIEKQLAETGKVRAIILKARQQGSSTYTEGRFYWRVTMNKGKQAFIITHEQSASDNLFAMSKRFYDSSHPALKPSISAVNSKEMVFNDLSSGFKIGTAGSKGVGRSGTIQYLHASEVAWWPNSDEHFAGIVQCVPDAASSEIIVESTANGASGRFYDLWQDAVNGKNEYIAIFVPWYVSSEYKKSAKGFKPTEEELKEKELYGLTLEQLAWRRNKISEIGKELTFQEYPSVSSEAFLHSGRTVFDKYQMAAALKECWKPLYKMVLENKRFIKRDDGDLSIWEAPKQGARYVIGADCAEGITGKDYSCADILSLPSGRQVGQWHGHIAPDLFGEMLYHLGKFYNNALIGPENNNHGLTVCIKLRDMGYSNLYIQTALDDRGSGEKETRKLGFTTTRKSKPYIIDNLSALFREEDANICCRETIMECQSYVVQTDGSYGANQGAHDDRVMSMAIAQYLAQQSPAYKKN